MSAPRIGSLCSGYGGLDMAVGAVIPDAELAWVSDIDKGACKVLAHRYPDVPNLGDFTKTDWATVAPIDILTAGYPCQPFSHAGNRKGANDERHLWPAVREAIRGLRPRLTLLENVAGHRSLGFDRVLGDLAEDGLHVQWTSVRASDVGACHRRERLFIVVTADPSNSHNSGPWSAGGEGGRWAGTQHGLGGGALLPTPAVNDVGEGKTVEAWDEWTAKMQATHAIGNGHGKSLAIEAQRLASDEWTTQMRDAAASLTRWSARPEAWDTWGEDQRLLPTPNAGDAKQGYVSAEDHAARSARKADQGIHLQNDLPQVVTTTLQWGDYAEAIARWEAITRPAPAPTQASKKGTPQLSAAFSEWMMGLPAGWITDVPGITRNEALKLAGNGVVWQQAAAALRIMLARAEDVAA